MDMMHHALALRTSVVAAPSVLEDPMGMDAPSDVPVATTRRGLVRLAVVAAETAARFVRDGIDGDPVDWMLSPRELFEGRAALDACLGRTGCTRAVLLHGLGLGVDAPAAVLDGIIASSARSTGDADAEIRVAPGGWDARLEEEPSSRSRGPGLFTRVSSRVVGREMVQAFEAVVADDRDAAAALMADDRPRDGLGDPIPGFDPSDPLVDALVSSAMADMLKQVAAVPGSDLAAGLSIRIEQRFAA